MSLNLLPPPTVLRNLWTTPKHDRPTPLYGRPRRSPDGRVDGDVTLSCGRPRTAGVRSKHDLPATLYGRPRRSLEG